MVRDDARREWAALILLWLAGNSLRLTILAVPPVIAAIRDEFGLSATEVGLLGSLAPALFAIAALGGSLIVARLGVRSALVGGLALVAIGSALRGLSPNFVVLIATTTLMSIGVAIMQPIMPTAVRQWLPGRIGLATAVYTNGLLAGEVFPVLLTIPLVLPAVGGSWRASFVVWSVVVAVIAIVVYVFAPRRIESAADAHAARSSKWLPDWRSGLVWRLGLMFGCVNATYFGANSFLPIYLTSAGRADLIGPTLTALNFGQIPASLLLLVVARRLERSAWPYVVCGFFSLLSIAGLVFQVGTATVVWAALLGFFIAGGLILALTLPPLLCRSEDVARTAAGAFTLSYGGAFAVAVVSGRAWDLSAVPALAFMPIALCAVGLMVIPGFMRARQELR